MLDSNTFIRDYLRSKGVRDLLRFAQTKGVDAARITGLSGSAAAVLAACLLQGRKTPALFIMAGHDEAAYLFNDLENLLGEKSLPFENRRLFLFPASHAKRGMAQSKEKAFNQLRMEVTRRLATAPAFSVVVSHPAAIAEKTISIQRLKKKQFRIKKDMVISWELVVEKLHEYGFEPADFVVEPGSFSLRGGILDLFSYANDHPFRLEFSGDRVESLRAFDPENQLSVRMLDQISILPAPEHRSLQESSRSSLLDSMPASTLVWVENSGLAADTIRELAGTSPDLYTDRAHFEQALRQYRLLECKQPLVCGEQDPGFRFHFRPQPSFNKNFDLLSQQLAQNTQAGFKNLILSDNPRQLHRIRDIFSTLKENKEDSAGLAFDTMNIALHEGFSDHDNKLACYTDHQIFERYHRYRIRDKFPGRQLMSLKELYDLKAGDYVTHIDHGIGIFSGLEKIEVNGRLQEAIRLIYKNNDILYISIHSLHRIAKYTGKEGVPPSLHRLGSNTWSKLKEKTKKRVRDIARDLIVLYARRKARKGHAFPPDTYLQNELEASFEFEDTPDQDKATREVKKDMESDSPMDRLICGDVGFGKTEVAIRAAFKAVSDSKQVAVLVPTTILALQHFYTFSSRLADFPCKVDYISRFRSPKETKQVLEDLQSGKTDIVIGTHRLTSKDVHFKDLGLLIIDEEQKFGVGAKEKLKQWKVNLDTLTLSATPIPRTLQFSLMGARDLSMINTPPPNRYPIVTEVHVFNEDLIRDAIMQEISRGGQVFVVHNRIQNIAEVAGIVSRLCPSVKVAVGHGQLDGSRLEQTMVGFIKGETDVLVSTSIIESGLDIPNANTIIILNAHHFGLSDLHQMRGRVGRTNRKAFCYLLAPSLNTLTGEARKRLQALEEFSELGSGFHIALRDLDIRGAGNLLGAEQSGFIAEIGFDMYHKILNEALAEMRENVYGDEAATAPSPWPAGRECQLETDLELMIPSQYVSNTQERLSLYKELDEIRNTEELHAFSRQLQDRFGPLPPPVKGLFSAVRLRRMACEYGWVKLILKGGKMIGHLPPQDHGAFYDGEGFGRLMRFIQHHQGICALKETGGRLRLSVKGIRSIDQALKIMEDLMA